MEISMILDTKQVMEHRGNTLTCGNLDENVHPLNMHEWIVHCGCTTHMSSYGVHPRTNRHSQSQCSIAFSIHICILLLF